MLIKYNAVAITKYRFPVHLHTSTSKLNNCKGTKICFYIYLCSTINIY